MAAGAVGLSALICLLVWHWHAFCTQAAHAACGSVTQAGVSSDGSVVSHAGAGSSAYPSNLTCRWPVTLPSGRFVQVTPASLSLADGDCLRVLRASDGVELTSVCNGTASGTLITLTVPATILFTTDGVSESTGFRLILRSVSNSSYTGCNGSRTIYSSSGSISSHATAGISNYANNLRCYWHLRVPAGRRVSVQFTRFQLERNYDYVYLYDSSSTDNQIVRLTDSIPTNFFSSTGSYMTVYFYTDASVTGRGFFLNFSSDNVPVECGSVTQAGVSSDGSVVSHAGAGSSAYPSNLTCRWPVTLPSGRFVQVTPASLSLADGDCLRVLRDSDGVELTSVCNGTASGTLITLTVPATILFTTDGVSESTGFRLILDPLSNSSYTGCTGSRTILSSSGSISSHAAAGISNYTNRLRCYWRLRVPAGRRVSVQFTRFQLERNYDYVYLYDGDSSSTDHQIVRLTDSLTTNTFSSTGSFMTVYFFTDGSVIRLGFSLNFTSVNVSAPASPASGSVAGAIAGAVVSVAAVVSVIAVAFCLRRAKAARQRPASATASQLATSSTTVCPPPSTPPDASEGGAAPSYYELEFSSPCEEPPPYEELEPPPPYPGCEDT